MTEVEVTMCNRDGLLGRRQLLRLGQQTDHRSGRAPQAEALDLLQVPACHFDAARHVRASIRVDGELIGADGLGDLGAVQSLEAGGELQSGIDSSGLVERDVARLSATKERASEERPRSR